MERKTNLTLPSYVWVGAETAKWPQAAEGETVAAFLCLFGMSEPPPKETLFPFEGVFFFGGGSLRGGNCGRSCTGGGTSTRLVGMTPPPSVVDATADWVRQYAPKGGRPGKRQTKRGPDVVVVEPDAPPPLGVRAKPPPPSPPPSH